MCSLSSRRCGVRSWTRGSHLAEGEGYFKTSGIARKFVEALPIREVPPKYVVLKPVAQLAERKIPSLVMFLANADQLSALLVLSNYHRAIREGAIAPFGAGCHSILYGFAEAERDHPRAVIGFTDITVRKPIGGHLMAILFRGSTGVYHFATYRQGCRIHLRCVSPEAASKLLQFAGFRSPNCNSLLTASS